MRIKTYILAADPAWIEASVLSYYDLVEEIVISYDQDHLGWTGAPVAVDECLRRLRAIDRDSKMRYMPGHYARLDRQPMENETYQRQCALNAAGATADWVLQLDTDEILMDAAAFASCLHDAESRGFDAMDFPARWIYGHLGRTRFLEACTRFWDIAAGYPGPIAVRAGTQLRHARQCDNQKYRVDFKPRNTDPWHPADAPVHRVVNPAQGILHLSMVREPDAIRRKTAAFGHAHDVDWDPVIRRWAWCHRHPYLASLQTPFRHRRHKHQLRIATIPMAARIFNRPHEYTENT